MWTIEDPVSRGTYGVTTETTTVQRTALPGEDNYGFVDRFTAGHAAFGVLAGLGRLPWWATLASGLFFDLVIERKFKDKWPALWPNSTQDTWQNITGDTVAMMLGWGLAKALPEGTKPQHTTIKELP
jgi:hypothetical protein